MVKVGDRVKLVKRDGAWCNDNVGKEGTVTAFDGGKYANVLFDNSERHQFGNDCGNISHLEIISTTPTYTIPADTETVTLKYADGSTQDIDVKDRARGVPEWVKDGAWVVNKISGVIARLSASRVGFNVDYLSGLSYNFSASDVHERFRPFTNSDWKWGMWAECSGEKVFVMSEVDHANQISISTPPVWGLPYHGFMVACAGQLTPTTAP